MFRTLRLLTSLLWRRQRRDVNEEQNEQRKTRTYPQSCSMDYKYLQAEKWQMCYSLEEDFASQIHMIMAFDAKSALIKSKDNMVYGVGGNLNGRLGLLIKDHYYTKPEKVHALCGKNIISFHCSPDEECFYALTEEGEVYSWGINDERHRLGKKMLVNKTEPYMPFKMDDFGTELRITQIACNNYNCLVLRDNGEVYVWGCINWEYIDITKCIVQSHPYLFGELEKEKIVQIACGMSFLMALTSDGKLYSWGLTKNGQLGLNTQSDSCIVPCLITSLVNVKIDKIVCGSEHSLALTSKGKIYSWGNNCKGQLGHGEGIEKEPVMLSTKKSISDIAAHHNTSVAIDKFGSIYVWGFYDKYGNDIIWKPIKIEYPDMYNVFRYKIPYIICTGKVFNDQLSDLTIEVEGKFIYVHKSVLIRCEYFKNIYQNYLREARNNTIKCDDFPYNVYKTFFKFLYTNAIDNLPLKQTFELLKLCEKYTKEDVNVSNVALCFALATERNAKDLIEYCVQFSLNKMSIIIKSEAFRALSKEMLLDFLKKTNDAGAFICRKCL